MPYKQTTTHCVVRLIAVRGLAPAALAQCQALRGEAGRVWTDLLTLHAQARRQGRWLSAGELEQATKGGQYALHSQSVQALCQKLAANVATATELRRQEWTETGPVQTQYPYHPKGYQTVACRDQALQVLPTGRLRLSTGGQRPPLLPLPEEHRLANRQGVEWTWRADHDELCLTLETGERQQPEVFWLWRSGRKGLIRPVACLRGVWNKSASRPQCREEYTTVRAEPSGRRGIGHVGELRLLSGSVNASASGGTPRCSGSCRCGCAS